MTRRLRTVSMLLMCLCLWICSITASATQEEYDNLKQQVQDASDAVDSIKNQKKDAENSKKELENQASSLTGKISSLNSQISTVSAEINDTEATIATVQADIDLLNESIAETEAALTLQRDSMKKRIQYMYENQTTNQLVNLLEAGSISELLTRLEYMVQISTYDQNAVAKYEETQSALEATQKEVQAKYDELSAYQESLNSKKAELGNLVSSTQTALNTTNNQIETSKAAIADLDAKLEEAKAYELTIAQAFMKAQLEMSKDTIGENGDYGGNYGASNEEIALLAALIQAEADNQGSDGRLAVGSVVMNRVASPKFPNSISGVIYQSGQFAPVASGRLALILAKGANKGCTDTAIAAIAGSSNTDALFFCTTTYVNNHADLFVNTEGIVIRDHYFYNRIK